MKIGFIGVGKMATAIIKGLQNSSFEIIISGSSPERSLEIAEQLQVQAASSHQDLIDQSDLVILGIKPQLFESVLSGLAFKQPLMSMAAGITLDRLRQLTNPQLPLLRIMPNINAQIQQSTTGLCGNDLVSPELLQTAQGICDYFGSTIIIAEKDFDTFTALAGSAPAYAYFFIEALAKAGVKNGLPKDQSLAIILQMLTASAQNLVLSGNTPNALIDQICSPGGATIAGLVELEKLGFSYATISAIDETIKKMKTL